MLVLVKTILGGFGPSIGLGWGGTGVYPHPNGLLGALQDLNFSNSSFLSYLSKSAKVWKALSTLRTPTEWHRQPKKSHNSTWMDPRSFQGENGNLCCWAW